MLSLYELNRLVRETVENGLPDTYWVTGELFEGRVGAGGHFYGELVQKDERTQAIVAKARLNIWANQYVRLRARFELETGQTFRAGLKVLVQVRVNFHEQFGFSLVGVDIDSSFTLGDLALQRREILRRLQEEGILHDNQTIPLPRPLNRIAVISSEHAAGYGDFCHQLQHNDDHLRFTVKLFPALMQGQHTENSVLQAMSALMQEVDQWDVLVIIRGGGATSDLADFESYLLASAVAQFPIPVIVGIGHERDETVLDHVAHTRVKTPTAAAAFLIDRQKEELYAVADCLERVHDSVANRLQLESQRLQRIEHLLPGLFARLRDGVEHRLALLQQRVAMSVGQRFERERSRVSLVEQRLQLLDPKRLLRLGYSITTCNGRLVRNATKLRAGDELTTQFEVGNVISVVK